MSSFRYDTSGNWYKGNIHIHSILSDGGNSAEELAQMYAGKGYHFLYLTDHWVASDIERNGENSPLLWLNGLELDGEDDRGSYFHVICLGTFVGITREMGLQKALKKVRAQNGFIILAHPHWTGNSQEDCLVHSFQGVEVFNYVTQWMNGKGDNAVFWNMMLERFPNTLAFAADDAHTRAEHPGWDGGWIMVNSSTLSRSAIDAAIRAGNFYSSCGPEIHSILLQNDRLTITTSPVQFVRLAGPGPHGQRLGSFEGKLIEQASFVVPEDLPYVYLEVEDNRGRRAWTNPLFKSAQ